MEGMMSYLLWDVDWHHNINAVIDAVLMFSQIEGCAKLSDGGDE